MRRGHNCEYLQMLDCHCSKPVLAVQLTPHQIPHRSIWYICPLRRQGDRLRQRTSSTIITRCFPQSESLSRICISPHLSSSRSSFLLRVRELDDTSNERRSQEESRGKEMDGNRKQSGRGSGVVGWCQN